jgi:hypothetical protein
MHIISFIPNILGISISLQCKIFNTGADKRGTNSPETEGAAPWMPSGGSAVHKSPSENNWTPGEGCIHCFGPIYKKRKVSVCKE